MSKVKHFLPDSIYAYKKKTLLPLGLAVYFLLKLFFSRPVMDFILITTENFWLLLPLNPRFTFL